MIRRSTLAAAALACAAPLAAQAVPSGPTLLRVAGSSGGVVLSLDSATIARSGASTFLVDAVYQLPADSTRHVAADRQVESQEVDCAANRVRGRETSMYLGDSPFPASTELAERPREWQPVAEDELPIFQAICTYLRGSFAASLPVTVELGNVEREPELTNRLDMARALAQAYPPALREARVAGVVRVRFQITADGRVDPATMRVAWATRPEFGAAALQVLPRMRFRPARNHGAPVAVWATLPLSFAIEPGPERPGSGAPGSGAPESGRGSWPARPALSGGRP